MNVPNLTDRALRLRRLATTRWLVAVVLVAAGPFAGTAWAHTDAGDVAGGLLAGLMHPLLGLDHVVAMVAVGIWGAQLGRPAVWVLPITFPLVMALGGAVGTLGLSVPGIEIGIALSAIVLGVLVVLAARPPLAVAAILVGLFAIFHGYAHGAELPGSASAIAYSTGFVIATGALHGVGILFGALRGWPAGGDVLRVTGAVIAAVGVWFLLPHLSGY